MSIARRHWPRHALFSPLWRLALLLLLCGTVSGCASFKLHSCWLEGGQSPLLPYAPTSLRLPFGGSQDGSRELLAQAGDAYERAESLARQDKSDCVDGFYRAAILSWSAYQCESAGSARSARDSDALRLYHTSLGRLIHEGQQHRRLHPSAGLHVRDGDQMRVVPLVFHGFAWQPEDFQEWLVVGKYHQKVLSRTITCDGLGVPLVILRCKERKDALDNEYLPPQPTFAATAFLRSDGSALELFDPLHTSAVEVDGAECPLAKDLSAPLAYYTHFHDRTWLEGFLTPGNPSDKAKLVFMEPYQSDKIPIVFLHGLLSDPRAWAEVFNEIRACPELIERYQIWAFKYPTGEPFLRSAAYLRGQLDEVRKRFDPEGKSDTLRQVVLVGHSMGGLVAKLQVSYSGEEVWYSVANLPLESVATDEATRARLAEQFFFDPHPLVRRVVFVATPHRGSRMADRLYGRIASALVSQPNTQYEKLKRDNVGGLKPSVSQRLPTSVDLLDPDSPQLKTFHRLPVSRDVALHSIIGHGYPMLGEGDSDSIVPVTSARYPGVQSELKVRASHSKILAAPETVTELKRILRLHASAANP